MCVEMADQLTGKFHSTHESVSGSTPAWRYFMALKHLFRPRYMANAIIRQLWLARYRKGLRAPPSQTVLKKRLFVDLSTIYRHDARTGIQRVVRGILLALEGMQFPHHELTPVAASALRGYCYLKRHETGQMRIGEPVIANAGDIFLGLDLSARYIPLYIEQLRRWRIAGAELHVVVYDLLPLLHPGYFRSKTRQFFSEWMECVRTEFSSAICISETVAGELQRFIDNDPSPRMSSLRISSIPLGSDLAATSPKFGISQYEAAVIDRLAGELTVLMVGTIEPRKGYDCALAAFEGIWARYPLEKSPNLLIIGRPGWKTERLQGSLNGHPFRDSRLFWLNAASDEVLDHFYRSSNLLLSTSYAEGFGLPLWEASSHGLRVLARDLRVTRELGIANCTLFEDDSAILLGDKIMEALDDEPLHKPSLKSLPTWSDSASAIIGLLGIETVIDYQDTSKVNRP